MHHHAQVRVGRIHSEAVEREGPERLLAGYDGVLVPGGFGERGIEGKLEAVRFARERGVPYLGDLPGSAVRGNRVWTKCGGTGRSQLDGVRQELSASVICLLDEQHNITQKGGTMRLGAQPAHLEEGSLSRALYGQETDFRTPSSSLRVQQCLQATVRGSWRFVRGHQSRRWPGRSDRTTAASLVCRGPVPSGVQIETNGAAAVVCGLRRCGD